MTVKNLTVEEAQVLYDTFGIEFEISDGIIRVE